MLHLPPYKTVIPTGSPSVNCWVQSRFPLNPFTSGNSWVGKVISSSHPLQTPIVMHLGTVRSIVYDADPEDKTVILNGSSANDKKLTFGTPFGTQGFGLRAPVVVLYNNAIGQVAFPGLPSDLNSAAVMLNVVANTSVSLLLKQHNVLFASDEMSGVNNLLEPFTLGMPSSGDASDPKSFSASWRKRTFDGTQWIGGSLLVLTGINIGYDLGGSNISDRSPYFQQGAPGTGIADTASATYYQTQATALAANFRNLQHFVYLREPTTSGKSWANKAVIEAFWNAIVPPSWMTIRKFFDCQADLTSTVTADVLSFLQGL